MSRYTYRPLDEAIEARRRAAMAFLGYLLLWGLMLAPFVYWFGRMEP